MPRGLTVWRRSHCSELTTPASDIAATPLGASRSSSGRFEIAWRAGWRAGSLTLRVSNASVDGMYAHPASSSRNIKIPQSSSNQMIHQQAQQTSDSVIWTFTSHEQASIFAINYPPSLFNMKTSTSLITAALVAYASAHGMVLSIQGANGVEMPGLTGKPRRGSQNGCAKDNLHLTWHSYRWNS